MATLHKNYYKHGAAADAERLETEEIRYKFLLSQHKQINTYIYIYMALLSRIAYGRN
jgi:hypothetical protein